MVNKLQASTALSVVTLFAMSGPANADISLRGFGGITAGPSVDDFSYSYSGSFGSATYSYSFDVDGGFIIGAAVGIDVSDWTFELEGAYRSADGEGELTVSSGAYSYSALFDIEFEVASILANAWYTWEVDPSFDVYAGGGAGTGIGRFEPNSVISQNAPVGSEITDEDIDDFGSETENGFAYQIGFGGWYNLSESLKVGAGYRYFSADLGDSGYNDSAVLAEIAFRF